MLFHPGFELVLWLFVQGTVMHEVSAVFHRDFKIAGVHLAGLAAEDRHQDLQLSSGLLPARHIGFIADRVPEPLAAPVAKIEAMRLTILKQVRAPLAIDSVQKLIVIM